MSFDSDISEPLSINYRKYANNNRGYYCFQPPFSFLGRLQLEGGHNYKSFSN